MAAFSRFLLFTSVSHFVLSQTDIEQKTRQLEETKLPSQSLQPPPFLHIDGVLHSGRRDPLGAAFETKAQHGRGLSATERDAADDADNRDGGEIMQTFHYSPNADAIFLLEITCSLSPRQRRDYRDASTRTWRVDDAVLKETENKLQLIIDCTDEGDALLFDVRQNIRPTSRVSIPWNLTISSVTENTRDVDSIYPRASRKTSFTCPREGEGFFLIKSHSVLLANLEFENCSFNSSAASGAIVEIEGCPTSSCIDGTVQLHHVSFRRNILLSGGAVGRNSSAGSALELIDFEFHNNSCSGPCGVILSNQNKLENVSIRRVVQSTEAKSNSMVFQGLPGSKTFARDITATNNQVQIFHIKGGSLVLEDSKLSNNSLTFGAQNHAGHGHVDAADSSPEIDGWAIQTNEAVDGAVLFMERESDIHLRNVSLYGNRATSGGAIALHDTKAIFMDLTISACQAEDGGGIYATSSRIEADKVMLLGNKADNAGGGMYMRDSTRAIMRNVVFSGNRAHSGGAVSAEENSSGRFIRVRFAHNSADEDGGAIRIYASKMHFTKCTFNNGTAENGGFIALRDLASVSIKRSSFKNASAEADGGCLHARDALLSLRHVTLQNCHSDVDGGVMRLTNVSVTITNTTMKTNSAKDDGGCLYAEESNITGNQWIAEGNSAGDHAGVLFIRFDTRLVVKNSVFRDSVADNGGIVFQEPTSTARFASVAFINSCVDTEGGSFFIDASETVFDNCFFEGSHAENGGFVYAKRRSSLTITNSEMKKGTGSHGGCLCVFNGHLIIKNSTVQDCNSKEHGGALHLFHVTASIEDSTISVNHADSDGGGLFAENTTLSGKRLSVIGNSADALGGGIHLKKSTFDVTDATLKGNSAVSGGAVYLSITSAALKKVASVDNLCTEHGGSFFMTDSSVNITHSSFDSGTAESNGAYIAATSDSAVVVEATQMTRGQAKDGGAIVAIESSFEGRSLSILNCTAKSDGGALKGIKTLAVSCMDCLFKGNKAKGKGGALSLEPRRHAHQIIKLHRCTMQDNIAQYGGGLHATNIDRPPLCSDEPSSCEVIALLNTTFVNNRAKKAGGAIFTNSAKDILVQCSAASDGKPRIRKEQPPESTDKVSLAKGICMSWKNNEAELYGHDVASVASRVVASITEDGENMTVFSEMLDPHTIKRYRSGTTLSIALKVVDDFGQAPAIGRNGLAVVSNISSPDHLFAGSYSVLLASDVVELNTTWYVKPGIYSIHFDFDDKKLRNVEVKVQVRECMINEVSSGEGAFCESCNAATYNFFPEDNDSCHPCPENGNCASTAIIPNEGYWQKSPCSVHIHRCLTLHACKSEGRSDILSNMMKDIEKCDFNDSLIDNYTEAQCAEGYRGPLCGSCNATHGRSHSFRCEECYLDISNGALVFLSFLVLLGLSAITIRGNLVSVPSLRVPRQTHSPQSPKTCTSSPEVPVNWEMVKMLTSGYVPAEIIDPAQERSSGSQNIIKKEELAKWKAIELFKISVNFLQVTALAIAVSVKWTVSMIAIFEAAEFFGGITSEAVNRSVDCLLPADSSVERSVISALVDMSQPFAAILVFLVLWTIVKIRHSESWLYLLKKTALSALVVFYISYISLSKTVINTLSCVEVYDSVSLSNNSTTSYWAMDTSVTCYEGYHRLLVIFLTLPFVLLFTLGFPLVIAILVMKNIAEDYKKGWIYDVSGFMYRSYRKECLFWESVIMVRKACLAVIGAFSYNLGADVQAVLASFVLMLALFAQMKSRPYRSEFDDLNDLESMSIFVSSLTFIFSIIFSENRVPSEIRMIVSLILSFFIVVLLYFFVSSLSTFTMNYLKLVLEREGVDFNKEGGMYHILGVYCLQYVFIEGKNTVMSSLVRMMPDSKCSLPS